MKKKKPLPVTKYPSGTKELIYFRLFIDAVTLAMLALVVYGFYDKLKGL